MQSSTTWTSNLALLLSLFRELETLEGTHFLFSADQKGRSILAHTPKKTLCGECWEEAQEFIQSAQGPCIASFSFESSYDLSEPSQILVCDHTKVQQLPKIDWEGKATLVARSDTKASYLEKVRAILEEISWGRVYQVNLSQEFTFKIDGDPATFWLYLVERMKPSYGAFLNYGEKKILSLSPELFVKRKAQNVWMSPIKGTLSVDQPITKLLESEKDLAELTMIVDLYRNDLSKYAKKGSVQVPKGVYAKQLKDVHHLLADVEACIDEELASLKLLRSLFPAGSISGCPKQAALREIAKHERKKRDVYTGAIGWLDQKGGMEMSVPIRTMTLEGQMLSFRLGGGIVADSDPEQEYFETLVKGRSFFEALGIINWREL